MNYHGINNKKITYKENKIYLIIFLNSYYINVELLPLSEILRIYWRR